MENANAGVPIGRDCEDHDECHRAESGCYIGLSLHLAPRSLDAALPAPDARVATSKVDEGTTQSNSLLSRSAAICAPLRSTWLANARARAATSGRRHARS